MRSTKVLRLATDGEQNDVLASAGIIPFHKDPWEEYVTYKTSNGYLQRRLEDSFLPAGLLTMTHHEEWQSRHEHTSDDGYPNTWPEFERAPLTAKRFPEPSSRPEVGDPWPWFSDRQEKSLDRHLKELVPPRAALQRVTGGHLFDWWNAEFEEMNRKRRHREVADNLERRLKDANRASPDAMQPAGPSNTSSDRKSDQSTLPSTTSMPRKYVEVPLGSDAIGRFEVVVWKGVETQQKMAEKIEETDKNAAKKLAVFHQQIAERVKKGMKAAALTKGAERRMIDEQTAEADRVTLRMSSFRWSSQPLTPIRAWAPKRSDSESDSSRQPQRRGPAKKFVLLDKKQRGERWAKGDEMDWRKERKLVPLNEAERRRTN